MLRSVQAPFSSTPNKSSRWLGGRGLNELMCVSRVVSGVLKESERNFGGCHTVSRTRRTFVLENITILKNRAEGRERLSTVASDRREDQR